MPRGNVLVDGDTVLRDDWAMIVREREHTKLKQPFPVPATHTDRAEEAYERVLAGAGAILPERDAVDERLLADIKAGTGRVIDSQEQVGGWPVLETGEAPLDTDADGMPDAWEQAHQLDPNAPEDQAADGDGDGYTNLETYLNELALRTAHYAPLAAPTIVLVEDGAPAASDCLAGTRRAHRRLCGGGVGLPRRKGLGRPA